MSSARAEWLAGLCAARTPDLIVHIGAGAGADMPDWSSQTAARVVLVEADPVKAAELRRMADKTAHVEVWEVAVSDHDGTRSWHRLSLADHGGLRTGSGLKELFPSLRQIGEIDVEVIGVQTLLDRIDLAPEQDAVLLLDARGEEETILRQLGDLDSLTQFADVFVTLPAVPLYQDSADADVLRKRLEGAGFRQVAGDDDDPDLPQGHFKLDKMALDLRRALAENADLLQRHEALLDDRTLIAQMNESLRVERDALDAELESVKATVGTLRMTVQTQQDAHDSLTRDHETLVGTHDALSEALQEARQTAETAQAALTETQSDQTQAQDRAERLATERDALNAELQATKSASETAQTSLAQFRSEMQNITQAAEETQQQLTERADTLAAERDRLSAELQEARKAAEAAQHAQEDRQKALSEKLENLRQERDRLIAQNRSALTQAETKAGVLRDDLHKARGQRELREADLLNLQSRYRQLHEAKEAQAAVLAELAGDLDLALALLKTDKASARKPAAARKSTGAKTKPSKAKS